MHVHDVQTQSCKRHFLAKRNNYGFNQEKIRERKDCDRETETTEKERQNTFRAMDDAVDPINLFAINNKTLLRCYHTQIKILRHGIGTTAAPVSSQPIKIIVI